MLTGNRNLGCPKQNYGIYSIPPTPPELICMRKLENSISVHGRAVVGIGTYAVLTASAVG